MEKVGLGILALGILAILGFFWKNRKAGEKQK